MMSASVQDDSLRGCRLMRHGVSVFPTSSNPFPISNATNILLQLFPSFSFTSSNLLRLMIPFYRFLVRRSYRLYEKGGLSHSNFYWRKVTTRLLDYFGIKIYGVSIGISCSSFFVYLHDSSWRDLRCDDGNIGCTRSRARLRPLPWQ